jgi:hypothetical protein
MLSCNEKCELIHDRFTSTAQAENAFCALPLSQELSASTKQLGSCQSSQQLSQLRDTATMMYLEVVQQTLREDRRVFQGRF